METAVDETVKALTEKCKSAQAHEALHYSQAVLNLMQAMQIKKLVIDLE